MKIGLRCDAGPGSIGMGHWVRCCVLAEELEARGHAVQLVTRADPKKADVRRSLDVARLPAHLSESEEISVLKEFDSIVVDLRDPTEQYLAKVCRASRVALFCDGPFAFALESQIMINPHPEAEALSYRIPPKTERLFGPKYLPLRREFRGMSARTHAANVQRMIVSFGASDPLNLTLSTANALRLFENIEVHYVLGAFYHANGSERREDLKNVLDQSRHRTEIHLNLDSNALKNLALRADLGLATPSTTAYELMTTGLPVIAVLADEIQHSIGKSLSGLGALVLLEEKTLFSPDRLRLVVSDLMHNFEQRRQLGATGQNVCDGRGAERIADAMERTT